jgi:hypothetical protein
MALENLANIPYTGVQKISPVDLLPKIGGVRENLFVPLGTGSF